MRADLEKNLISRYPEIFKNVYCTPRESPMAFGIECGSGWYDLIDKLCSDLTELGVDVVADQVKEKFGGLRFYCHISDNKNKLYRYCQDKAWKLIAEAEEKSYHICERCGKPGALSSNRHWFATLCEDHRKELNYKLYKEDDDAEGDA